MIHDIPHYFPPFLWKFWLGNAEEGAQLHAYDIYSNDLFDTAPISEQNVLVTTPVFDDLDDSSHLPGTRHNLERAETKFCSLLSQVETLLQQIIQSIYTTPSIPKAVSLDRAEVSLLKKFFVFLRFRNSNKYRQIVYGLMQDQVLDVHSGSHHWRTAASSRQEHHPNTSSSQQCRMSEIYGPLWRQVRCQAVLTALIKFLDYDPDQFGDSLSQDLWMAECDERVSSILEEESVRTSYWDRDFLRQRPQDPFLQLIRSQLFDVFKNVELCLGVSEQDQGQHFILPDCCYGILDESFTVGVDGNPSTECLDCFFPILPTLALYLINNPDAEPPSRGPFRKPVVVEVGLEQPSDVFLRNSIILSSLPKSGSRPPSRWGPRLYFSSLPSITRSITEYDTSRCQLIPDQFYDYSRLKQRCRQRFLKESVTKMLVIKDNLRVWDLTDEIKLSSKGPIAFGAFSDVWQGRWWDRVEHKERAVAIKFLRQVTVQNVREKLFKRLQSEVMTWHGLCHSNVASFFGVVSNPHGIGMVSEWCENGTVEAYLKNNPGVDRMLLLIQVASGVAYLHSVQPPVVHGDLKGTNILIDVHGRPVITDFGLSKVIEDLPELSIPPVGVPPELMLTSSFGGSTRWMAPELIGCLLEDRIPVVTTYSDVWAFGGVCLEIVTGQIPYPQRRNNASVQFDISRGVKPSRGSCLTQSCYDNLGLVEKKVESFVRFLESCWDDRPPMRPRMEIAWKRLVEFAGKKGSLMV